MPKPTVAEFDRVFGLFRQHSRTEYRQWRDWILSLNAGGAVGVTDITFADLSADLAGGTATAGQIYQITDYQTTQTIPLTVDTNTGPVEPLIVQARSESELFPWAISTINPQDEIVYDIDSVQFGATFGAIMFRFDPITQNKGWFDIRTFVYRRWDDGAGNFIVTSDNGNPFRDDLAFGGQGLFTSVENVDIGQNISGGVPVQVNTVVNTGCNSVKIGAGASQNTILDNGFNIRIGESCRSCTIFQNAFNIEMGDFNVSNSINADCQDIKIGITVTNITILNGCNHVEIGDDTDFSTIDALSNFITIGRDSTFITIGVACQFIEIGDNCSGILIADSNENIRFNNDILDRSTLIGEQNREEWRTRARITFSHDFSINGAVGTYNKAFIDDNAYVLFGTVQTLVTLVGGAGSTIDMGTDVAGPTEILPSTLISDATFDGFPSNLTPQWTRATFTTVTAAQQNIILTVGDTDITDGSILVKLWIEYSEE